MKALVMRIYRRNRRTLPPHSHRQTHSPPLCSSRVVAESCSLPRSSYLSAPAKDVALRQASFHGCRAVEILALRMLRCVRVGVCCQSQSSEPPFEASSGQNLMWRTPWTGWACVVVLPAALLPECRGTSSWCLCAIADLVWVLVPRLKGHYRMSVLSMSNQVSRDSRWPIPLQLQNDLPCSVMVVELCFEKPGKIRDAVDLCLLDVQHPPIDVLA